MAIVEAKAILLNKSSIVSSSICGVAVFDQACGFTERPRIAARAFTIFSAGTCAVMAATRSVKKSGYHDLKQFGVEIRIGKLCTDELIDVVRSLGLAARIQNGQAVSMRKSSLLEFDHID